jgi:hypothetical protein
MYYKIKEQSGGTNHIWDVSSLKGYDGGFSLDKTNLNSDVDVIEKGVPLSLDFTERKAKVLNIVVAYAAANAAATTLNIAKGSYIKDSCKLYDKSTGATIVVSAIDKSNDDYDALTVASLGSAVAEGAALYEVFDTTTKKAVILYEGVSAGATTSLKVLKGSQIKAQDVLLQGDTEITVSAVANTNASYDTLTCTSFTAVAAGAGTVLVAKTAVQVLPVSVLAMNYDDVKVEDETSVNAVFQAEQVVKSNLPFKYIDKLGDELSHFVFV